MNDPASERHPDGSQMRRGWTTGACATAAAKSAAAALLTGSFEDPVAIELPGGQRPAFALAHELSGDTFAEAGIIKDAGDDPDVTHGALVIATVRRGPPGGGVSFHAGDGVGTVTRPGLPLAVGEPAINPVPRRMIAAHLGSVAASVGAAADFSVTIGVRDGARIAAKTWNPRLGIVGGLSILGTTGIVIPYSCSAWIHSIHRGIDVARAMGLDHIVGATGDTSEKAAMARLGLPLEAFIDMGDFVGGLLKYVRAHPLPRVTIAGGFAKLSKLAFGALDLHSARSQVDLDRLAVLLEGFGAAPELSRAAAAAGSAGEVLLIAQSAHLDIAGEVARLARVTAQATVGDSAEVDVLVVARDGAVLGGSG